ncbi:sulfite exporter TauE/SafE family protein [Streptomyces sp. NP160]|uniref:sulfite exporter TauE/SafE family protein n=1 Tax=Streptomyces sp. NP160 TaxID=2586637 RepID=UPI00111A5618|nr:sulfite exporter TauE/SafE family protein [Streptomyces sp. NP160]
MGVAPALGSVVGQEDRTVGAPAQVGLQCAHGGDGQHHAGAWSPCGLGAGRTRGPHGQERVVIQALLVPDSTALLVGLCALVFLSSVLQTATGFGFAILSAPIGAALLGGPAAVGMVLITGTAVDVLILSLHRSLPRPRWDEVAVLGASSLPGLALGAVLLAVALRRVLLVVIAAAVVLAVVLRWVSRRSGRARVVSRRWGVLAGLASGTLGTATTLAGPPTVFYLSHRPYVPGVVRDTLVVLNMVRLPLSVVALVAGGVFVVIPGIWWCRGGVGTSWGSRCFGGWTRRVMRRCGWGCCWWPRLRPARRRCSRDRSHQLPVDRALKPSRRLD